MAEPVLDCADFWQAGYRGLPDSQGLACIEFNPGDPRSLVGGGDHRVFYPPDWIDAVHLRLVEAVAEALNDSVVRMREFGRVPQIHVVFWDHRLVGDFTWPADAASTYRGLGEPCPITLYESLEEFTVEQLKQVIAHEVFHCYQGEHYGLQLSGSSEEELPWLEAYDATSWWAEGSADFFSNVVYPEVNLEFQSSFFYEARRQIFVQGSEDERGYENGVLFQSLANQIGEEGVLRLIGSLPTEGTLRDQAGAVAAFPEMDQLFHEFGRQFFGNGIADTGGGTLPVQAVFGDQIGFAESGEYSFEVEPFTLDNRLLIFLPERRHTLEIEVTGGPYRVSSRVKDSAHWLDGLPEEIFTSCDAGKVLELLITGTSGSPEPLQVTLTVEIEDEAERRACNCEATELHACLPGKWRSTPDSLATAMGGEPGDIQSGAVNVTITPNGRFSKSYETLRMVKANSEASRTWEISGSIEGCISSLHPGGEAVPDAPRYLVILDPWTDVLYTYEVVPLVQYWPYSFTVHDKPPQGPEPVGLRWFSMPYVTDGLQIYSCEQNTLEIRNMTLQRVGE